MIICSKILIADPQDVNCVLGWAVIHQPDWTLIALLSSQETAAHMARLKGNSYIVEYCTHRPGTTEFAVRPPP